MAISTYIPPPRDIGYPWYVNVDDPAAGVSTVYLTIPDIQDYWSYYINAVYFEFQTGVAVADRFVGCRLFYHTGSPGTLWELFYTTEQTADSTYRYCFVSRGVNPVNMEGVGCRTGGVPLLAMNGTLRFAVKVAFIEAADQLRNIWFQLALFYPSGYKVNFSLP